MTRPGGRSRERLNDLGKTPTGAQGQAIGSRTVDLLNADATKPRATVPVAARDRQVAGRSQLAIVAPTGKEVVA